MQSISTFFTHRLVSLIVVYMIVDTVTTQCFAPAKLTMLKLCNFFNKKHLEEFVVFSLNGGELMPHVAKVLTKSLV